MMLRIFVASVYLKFYLLVLSVFAAYALKMFREEKEMSTKKQMEKARKDPIKSHAPQKPISGSSMFISSPTCDITCSHVRDSPYFILVTFIKSMRLYLKYLCLMLHIVLSRP